MALKIAMIGAGSVGFTRRLIQDILTVPELGDTTFALTDLSEHNMDIGGAALPQRYRKQRSHCKD